MRLRLFQPQRRYWPPLRARDGIDDRVADVRSVGQVLHPRHDRGEPRIGGRGHVGEDLVYLLLLLHQPPVQVRRFAEVEVKQHVEGREVLLRLREGGAVEAHGHPRERLRLPWDMGRDRCRRHGLSRDVDGVSPPLPPAPVALDHCHDFGSIDVARDDDRRVLGPVPAPEELTRVFELVRHVFDVREEAHRRVLVGVPGECVLALHLDELVQRIGAVLVVFAEHGPGLGLEVLFGIGEVHEPVGLNLKHRLQVFPGECDVVVRVVVGGVGVLAGARPGDDLLVAMRRVAFGAAEHHVFEEVCEPGLPRLDLVPRARLDRDLQRNQVREPRRDDDDLEAICEGGLSRLEGKDVATGRGAFLAAH